MRNSNREPRHLSTRYFCRSKGYTNDYVKNPPSFEERCEIAYLAGWAEPSRADDKTQIDL